ncbi:MAG: amino acid ABC transporter substrate-binding protein [Curvibacter sp.]|nr:amino acid ABC transporter substrate-binding protein [Curvibacter sp.]
MTLGLRHFLRHALARRALVLFGLTLAGLHAVAAEPELTMLVGSLNAPKMFLSEEGRPTGYFTELADALARRAGYSPRLVAVPWPRAVLMAEQGDGVVASLSRTPERERLFLFSDPILEEKILIVTLKRSNLTAASLADLQGRKVGLSRGSKYGARFVEELPLVETQEDDSTVARLKKLSLGRIDAAIVYGGMASVVYNAQLAGVDMADLTVQGTPLALDKNYFGIAKTRPDAAAVLRNLNAANAAMKADGGISAILHRWGEIDRP